MFKQFTSLASTWTLASTLITTRVDDNQEHSNRRGLLFNLTQRVTDTSIIYLSFPHNGETYHWRRAEGAQQVTALDPVPGDLRTSQMTTMPPPRQRTEDTARSKFPCQCQRQYRQLLSQHLIVRPSHDEFCPDQPLTVWLLLSIAQHSLATRFDLQ